MAVLGRKNVKIARNEEIVTHHEAYAAERAGDCVPRGENFDELLQPAASNPGQLRSKSLADRITHLGEKFSKRRTGLGYCTTLGPNQGTVSPPSSQL